MLSRYFADTSVKQCFVFRNKTIQTFHLVQTISRSAGWFWSGNLQKCSIHLPIADWLHNRFSIILYVLLLQLYKYRARFPFIVLPGNRPTDLSVMTCDHSLSGSLLNGHCIGLVDNCIDKYITFIFYFKKMAELKRNSFQEKPVQNATVLNGHCIGLVDNCIDKYITFIFYFKKMAELKRNSFQEKPVQNATVITLRLHLK